MKPCAQSPLRGDFQNRPEFGLYQKVRDITYLRLTPEFGS